jgi:hypothetical protein
MKYFLTPLNSIASLAPEAEFYDAWQLVSALHGLEQFTQGFRISDRAIQFLGTAEAAGAG